MKFKYMLFRTFGCLIMTSLAFIIFSCGKSKEEQVKEFAVDFAEKASKNQIDSLVAVYPDIENADSVALKYIAEGIVIHPSEDGKEYEILLNPDVSIIVKPMEDGSFTVTESRGLFAFPEEKISIAKNYDLWNRDLPDAELANNIKIAGDKQLEDKMAEDKKMRLNPEFLVKDKSIDQNLKNIGFKVIKKTSEEWDAEGLDYYVKTTYNRDYNGNIITVENHNDNDYYITFSNKEEMNQFLADLKSFNLFTSEESLFQYCLNNPSRQGRVLKSYRVKDNKVSINGFHP